MSDGAAVTSSITTKRVEHAARAFRKRLHTVDTLCATIDRARQATPRQVHRLRRACRAVGAAIAILPPESRTELKRLRKRIRAVRRAAGAVRDVDVTIATVRAFPAAIEHPRATRAIVRRLRDQRKAHLKDLLRAVARWRSFHGVRDAAPSFPATPESARATLARFRRTFTTLRKSPIEHSESLHRVRIAARKIVGVLKALGVRSDERDTLAALAARLGESQDLAIAAASVQAAIDPADPAHDAERAILTALRRAAERDHRQAVRDARPSTPRRSARPRR